MEKVQYLPQGKCEMYIKKRYKNNKNLYTICADIVSYVPRLPYQLFVKSACIIFKYLDT